MDDRTSTGRRALLLALLTASGPSPPDIEISLTAHFRQVASGDVVELRICKKEPDPLEGSVHATYIEQVKFDDRILVNAELPPDSADVAFCTVWTPIDTAEWSDMELMRGQLRIVSPARCQEDWGNDHACSGASPRCGFCWAMADAPGMRRTCL